MKSLDLHGRRAVVAVSGGLDSVTLLDLLVRARDAHELELMVVHVDHGIHPDSGRIAEMVRAIAGGYGIGVEVCRLELGASATETVARVARYLRLEDVRRRFGAEYVFLGHHADDQAETVLMRVLRGSGPAGLAAMSLRSGALVRPLLPFRRAQLAEHFQGAGLVAWSDPANADVRHLRSWIRTELLPSIRARLPDVDTNLLQLASHAARDRAAWEQVLYELPGLAFRLEEDGVSMDAAFLASATDPLAEALLVAASRRVGAIPGPARLARVRELLRTGASGAAVPLGGVWRAAMSFGRLHIVAVARAAESEPLRIDGDRGEGTWGRWRFRWRRDTAPAAQEREALTAWFSGAALIVRTARAGERIRPLGGAGGRPVVRCLQDRRIPHWRRASWPMVATPMVGTPTPDPAAAEQEAGRSRSEIVWIPGVCRSARLVPLSGTDALRLDAERV